MNRLIVFFLTSLFMFSCGSQLSMDTDDMLKLSGRDRLPTQADFPDDGAVVLYEDTESRLYLDSEWEVNVETSYHIAVLYLNDKAETGWATREIYLSDEMILSDFSARTIKANGEIIPLTKDDLHPTKLIDGADQISHEKSVKFVFPGVEPGAILEYSFTINDQGWFVGDIWFIQKDIPVLYTKYTMEIPTIFFKYKNNWTYSTNAIQLGEPQVLKNILTERSEKDQSRIFYWEITDIPAFEDEPNAPPYFDIAQYVRYDIKYKDWNELTEGYWKSLIPKFSDSDKPDIQQLAKDIIGDAEDEQTKIERIFAYTQKNFRYISTSIRRSGYIPNTCDQIIKNQYGDCKNMTVLNVNLLRAVGIEAFPALVATKSLGTIRKDITSISMFNHMIAYVKTRDNKVYWLDATGSNCPVGEVYASIEGVEALVIYDDGKSEFIKIPESRFPDNTVQRDITLTISRKGGVEGHAVLLYTGNENLGMRSHFKDASVSDMKKVMESYLNSNMPDITISNLVYDNPKDIEKQFKIEFDFSKEKFGSFTSSLLIFNPSVFKMKSDLDRYRDEERKHAIVFSSPFRVIDNVEINYNPSEYMIEGLNKPVNEKYDFASLRSYSTYEEDGKITYTRDYSIRKTYIKSSEYQNLRNIEKAIAAANDENIVLKKK